MSADVPQPTGPRAALRLIAHPNFGPYFAGNALSASGTWFQSLAAALLVYRQTESPFLLGVLGFAQFIPILLLAPWAGAAADRFDRRRLLIGTQLASVVLSTVLALLAFADLAPPAVVIAFALALGVSSAVSTPAQFALLGSLVERHQLQTAVALHSMTFNLARVVGPTLAAGAVAVFGIPTAFLINAGSYLFFVAALLRVRPRAYTRAAKAPLRESFALLRREPRLVWFLLVVMAVGFASDPINTEAPAFAHAFDRPDTWAGVVIGVFGAGAVSAAFFFAGREGSPRLTVVTLTLLAAGMTGFSLASSLWVGFPFLFLAGFFYLASNARATAQLQLGVDDAQRGRVMALWSVAFLGLRPVASLVDGAVAQAFGVRAAGIVLALPALAVAAAIAWRIRRRERLAADGLGEPLLERDHHAP